jgi:magnesium transporter
MAFSAPRLLHGITTTSVPLNSGRNRPPMHPADIAYILEALPLEERLIVWDLVKAERDGEILLEVSDAVRESLIESMDPEELKAAAETLDADELADLAPDLPQEVIEDVFQSLDGRRARAAARGHVLSRKSRSAR